MQKTFTQQTNIQNTPDSKTRVLNYVWINKDRFFPNSTAQCGVPLHYIDRAIANAKRYPDTEVDIWIDFDLVDDQTMKIVRKHVQSHGPNNVEIKNLQKVPAYKDKNTLFDPERDISKLRDFSGSADFEKHNIWGRVDLTRLLVLQHSLNRPKIRDVVYSDFDAPDVRLDDPKVQSQLNEFGMVFGGRINDHGETIIENDYFAFRKSRMDTTFFQELVTETEKEVAAGYNGYGPFYQKTKQWFSERGIDDFVEVATIQVSPLMQFKIPKPPEYEGLCV